MVFILHVSKRYAYLTSSEFSVFIPSADIAQWGRWTWLPCTAPPNDPGSPFCGFTPSSWRSVSSSGFPSKGEPAATHLWKCLSFLPRAWRTVLNSSLEVVFPQESEGLCQVPSGPWGGFSELDGIRTVDPFCEDYIVLPGSLFSVSPSACTGSFYLFLILNFILFLSFYWGLVDYARVRGSCRAGVALPGSRPSAPTPAGARDHPARSPPRARRQRTIGRRFTCWRRAARRRRSWRSSRQRAVPEVGGPPGGGEAPRLCDLPMRRVWASQVAQG